MFPEEAPFPCPTQGSSQKLKPMHTLKKYSEDSLDFFK
jgi:hypothetical protein